MNPRDYEIGVIFSHLANYGDFPGVSPLKHLSSVT